MGAGRDEEWATMCVHACMHAEIDQISMHPQDDVRTNPSTVRADSHARCCAHIHFCSQCENLYLHSSCPDTWKLLV